MIMEKILLRIAIVIIVLLVVNNMIPLKYKNGTVSKSEIKDAIREHENDKQKEYYRNNIFKLLNPHTNNYQKDIVFGGIWDLIIKIDNPSPYTLDEVWVVVNYIKADGNLHKSEVVYFKNMPAGQQILQPAPNSDKGVEVKCRVERVICTEIGL